MLHERESVSKPSNLLFQRYLESSRLCSREKNMLNPRLLSLSSNGPACSKGGSACTFRTTYAGGDADGKLVSVCRRSDSGEEKDALTSSGILISYDNLNNIFETIEPFNNGGEYAFCSLIKDTKLNITLKWKPFAVLFSSERWALIGCLKPTNKWLHMPAEDLQYSGQIHAFRSVPVRKATNISFSFHPCPELCQLLPENKKSNIRAQIEKWIGKFMST